MIVIAIITEYIDATSTNPNGLFHRQTSNQKVIVASINPKGKVSNRALSCYALPIPLYPVAPRYARPIPSLPRPCPALRATAAFAAASPYARPGAPCGLAEAEGCRRREGLCERVGASALAAHARHDRHGSAYVNRKRVGQRVAHSAGPALRSSPTPCRRDFCKELTARGWQSSAMLSVLDRPVEPSCLWGKVLS